MNIIDNITFGLGYYDPVEIGIKEVKDLVLKLNPFETKTFQFYIYGSKVEANSLVNIISNLESLVESSKVSLSISNDKGRKYWTSSDVVYTSEGVSIYPVRVSITNTYYSELNTNLKLDLSLQTDIIKKVNTLSYYGELGSERNYEVLPREIEIKSQRSIIIDPVPEGSDYTYLSYSSGDTLIFLDDDTGIPYTPTEPETLVSKAAMSLPDAGFYMWDDGEIVDWDTDINTDNNQGE